MSIKFVVNRGPYRKITGFTLLGSENDQDIAFCLSFMRAWEFGWAEIVITKRSILFVHSGIGEEVADRRWGNHGAHPGGTHIADLSPHEEEELLELLAEDLFVKKEGVIRPQFCEAGRGFTFVKRQRA